MEDMETDNLRQQLTRPHHSGRTAYSPFRCAGGNATNSTFCSQPGGLDCQCAGAIPCLHSKPNVASLQMCVSAFVGIGKPYTRDQIKRPLWEQVALQIPHKVAIELLLQPFKTPNYVTVGAPVMTK